MAKLLNDDEIAMLLARGQNFRSRSTVQAFRVSSDSTWTTELGDVLRASAGDWWVIDGEDRWSVSAEVFSATYEKVDDDVYRKTAAVTATRISESFSVDTLEGRASGEPGDWLVRNPSGECWPVPSKQFTRRYEEA